MRDSALSFILAVPLAASAQRPRSAAMPPVIAALDAKSAHYTDVAKQIWGFAELGYEEVKAHPRRRRRSHGLLGAGGAIVNRNQ